VIAKAMSFPAAEYIVYSTCSVHKVRLILVDGFSGID
jgi:hypothetical protein